MIIDRVTITGADDNTKGSDLLALQEKYPFVEWGILFSKSKIGTARYPSIEWMYDNLAPKLNLSAHYCGWHSKEVIENANFKLLNPLVDKFKRVQLNFNFKGCLSPKIVEIIKYATTVPNLSIIFQYNKSNSSLLNYLMETYELPKNIHFLYDSSGGRGTEIKELENPFKNYTGYSGGLNPDNIQRVCHDITVGHLPRNSHRTKVWIDMESGVRTNDVLDLDKVETVLGEVDKYWKGEAEK